MTLDHTIIPCSDKTASAKFYAEILGLQYDGQHYHFELDRADEPLKLLFDNRKRFESHHYAFKATAQEYTATLNRIKERNYPYGDSPMNRTNKIEYRHDGEKGFYFDDSDGHVLEVITDL